MFRIAPDYKSQLVTVLYPWTTEKAEIDRKEAEEAGLYFTADRGSGERYTFNNIELAALREVLNRAAVLRGNAVTQSQTVWRETDTYDRNGNRASKTTPWGTVRYEYDAENRLIRKGDIAYTNDRDGNVLSEKGLRHEAAYEYNGQNRMTYSEVTSHADRTHTVTMYEYDALGRRTLTQSVTGQAMRTLYDGKGFEVVREGEAHINGSLTTRFATGTTVNSATSQMPSTRYRWIGEDGNAVTTTEDGYAVQGGRYGSRGVALYGNGEAVAVSYSSSEGGRSLYLGKDILGSVKTATTDSGALEDRYEYDAFGTVYHGDLSGGMNLGYLGKPYDNATGLYNYGYRDYSPQAARFTTVDPVRANSNWYIYVSNNPTNYIDKYGLWELLGDGTAKAEPNDTLSHLALMVTGNANNWSQIGFDRDPTTLQIGEVINYRGMTTVVQANVYIVEESNRTRAIAESDLKEATITLNSQGIPIVFDMTIYDVYATTSTGKSVSSITVSSTGNIDIDTEYNSNLIPYYGNVIDRNTQQELSIYDPSRNSYNFIYTPNIYTTSGTTANGFAFYGNTTVLLSNSIADNTTEHEIGHTLNLIHNNANQNLLMYGEAINGGTNKIITSVESALARSYLGSMFSSNSATLGTGNPQTTAGRNNCEN